MLVNPGFLLTKTVQGSIVINPPGPTPDQIMNISGPLGLVVDANGGALSNIRSSNGYVIDHEDILRLTSSDELRFEGLRRVENIILFSDDYTLGLGNTANNNATPTTIEFTAASAYKYKKTNTPTFLTGSTIIGRMTLSSSDKNQVGLRLLFNGSSQTHFTVNLTPTPTIYTLSITSLTDGSGGVDFGLDNRTSFSGDGTSVGTITVTDVQVEISTGQANQNTSEYVLNAATGTSSEYFNTLNGNTVTSNVLTEAVGSAISGIKTILFEPAATNLCLHSQDFSNAAWVKTTTTITVNDDTGPDSQSRSDLLTATAANSTTLQSITTAIDDYVASFYIKRVTGTGDIDITIDNGATWTTVSTTSTWTKFEVTQNLANPIIGIRIVTSGDEIHVNFSQLEQGLISTSPINTVTTAISRASDDISIPLSVGDNFFQNEGMLFLRVIVGYDSDTTLNSFFSIFDGAGLLSDSATIDTLTSTDGTNTLNISQAFSVGNELLIALLWDSTDMSVNVSLNGGTSWLTWADSSYDGAFVTGTDINLFFQHNFVNHLRSAIIYNLLNGGTIPSAKSWAEANAGSETS